MTFVEIHGAWAWVVVLTNAAAGGWALAAHRVESLRVRYLWWLVTASQVAVAVQALLGVLVMQVDGREASQLHVVYGFVGLASVGILYSYRQQLQQWRFLLYGFGCLFLMGMGIRGMIM